MSWITSVLKEQDDFLYRRLMDVEGYADVVWERPLFRHYTDHTPKRHSKRIIEILEKLLLKPTAYWKIEEGEKIFLKDTYLRNTHELFILMASAYLHDVGMQCERCVQRLERRPFYELTEDDFRRIRENHGRFSEEMILGSISDPTRYPNLGLQEAEVRQYAPPIAKVSRAHSEPEFLFGLEPGWLAGEMIRLLFLAALLRFADELDRDYRRVHLDQLKVVTIPVESKLHWWLCHYTNSINISGHRICLDVMMPVKYKGDFDNYLCNLIESSVKEEYDTLERILWDGGLKVRFDGLKREFDSHNIKELLVPDLEEYVSIEIEKAKKIPISPAPVFPPHPNLITQYRDGRGKISYKGAFLNYEILGIASSLETDVPGYNRIEVHMKIGPCPRCSKETYIVHRFTTGIDGKFTGVEFVECPNHHSFFFIRTLKWIMDHPSS